MPPISQGTKVGESALKVRCCAVSREDDKSLPWRQKSAERVHYKYTCSSVCCSSMLPRGHQKYCTCCASACQEQRCSLNNIQCRSKWQVQFSAVCREGFVFSLPDPPQCSHSLWIILCNAKCNFNAKVQRIQNNARNNDRRGVLTPVSSCTTPMMSFLPTFWILWVCIHSRLQSQKNEKLFYAKILKN